MKSATDPADGAGPTGRPPLLTPPPPPRGRPPAHSAIPFLLAMHVLERHGYRACDPQRFAHAHAQQCCHLCHMPYASAHAACPCPHWFLMPWPDLAGFGAVFAMFGVAGVVHYLLTHACGARREQQPRRTVAATRDGNARLLQLKVRGRNWAFALDAGAAMLAVELHGRGARRPRMTCAATAHDAAIMAALVDAIEGAND